MHDDKRMYDDKLEIALAYSTDSAEHKVQGSDIQALGLELHPWGFSGRVRFQVQVLKQGSKDKLLPDFLAQDLASLELSVARAHQQRDDALADPITVKGLVTDKLLEETVAERVQGDKVITRIYTVYFEDPARLIWRQHCPSELYTELRLDEVINKQRLDPIKLKLDWPLLETKHPHVCFGLGQDVASFYDWLIWYVDAQGGALWYDYAEATYNLAAAKPTQAGTPLELYAPEVRKIQLRLPETPRHGVRVRNSYAEASKTEPIKNEQGLANINHDVLLRAPLAADAGDRKALETERLRLRQPELLVESSNFPEICCVPGSWIKMDPKLYSKTLVHSDAPRRVTTLRIEAQRSADHEPGAVANYQVSTALTLEAKDEAVVPLPAHRTPRYPIRAEGKIVCESGDEGDRTYMIHQDDETSLDYYVVQMPLWDEQQIQAPFCPLYFAGHFYAPAYKAARVLVELSLHTAEIVRYLDWGPDVRLPQDGQGNHLLFGKNNQSETSMQHFYEDEKPVLSVRRNCDGDTELLKMEEGSLVLQTKEE